MKKYLYIIITILLLLISGLILLYLYLGEDDVESMRESSGPVLVDQKDNANHKDESVVENKMASEVEEEPLQPMAIESLRKQDYPGGDFEFVETLTNGTNYQRYVVSYTSEACKIYGLLTVPVVEMPENGYPAVVFVHGYIPPKQYSTINNYPTYQARLARSEVVTFKPDLRGHGNSECEPVSAHYSEKYVIDVMNAIEYMKDYEKVDPERIGYWGHSNGGEIGLRVAVISEDIKAASFWAGVVGSYVDMFETYRQDMSFLRDATSSELVLDNGLPSENREFWTMLDPYAYLSDIDMPIEIQHGTNDQSVPIELSLSLKNALKEAGVLVEYWEYKGDDHNIGVNASRAWSRTIDFFDRNL